MKINIQYAADKKLAPVKPLLTQWASQALAGSSENSEVTIRIVDIKEMSELNSKYRRKTGPTNVLSFPADIPAAMSDEFPLLGDIIICAEVVNREAAEQNKLQQSHWAHMVIHGIFHLLGYDHVRDEDAEKMEQLEINVMRELGFENPYEHGEHVKHHE